MRVAVLGAGIQGCTIAMELAAKGARVDLFDQGSAPMQRASRWNEGKLHLGYVYGRDPSLRTARKMIEGSLDFHDFFARHFESTDPLPGPSRPFEYLVPNESLLTASEVEHHLGRVDELVREALAEGGSYLGSSSLRRADPVRLEPNYDTRRFQAAFRTSEVSVDTHRIAARIVELIEGQDRIDFHPGVRVTAAARGRRFRFTDAEDRRHGPYDRLVNATWESRLALDATLGIEPPRRWLHRYKLALHVFGARPTQVPSTTMVLGAFGDVVNFGNGSYYLSWYPDGRIGESTELQPPEWEDRLSVGERDTVTASILAALSARIPALEQIDLAAAEVRLGGGHIFAWGEGDIDRYESRLHQRFDVGVRAHDGYFSVDTGKYCLATLHARECARRVLEVASAVG